VEKQTKHYAIMFHRAFSCSCPYPYTHADPRRFVEKKTSEFYVAFNVEINIVKKLFDAVRRMPPKSPILPKYAGTAR